MELYLCPRDRGGGAFGVIIGWFASNSTDSSTLVHRISGTPFTLAFIAGFAIQTLSDALLKYTGASSGKQI